MFRSLLDVIMSYFRENIDKSTGYTPGFQPEGVDVVKLNTNENPYLPSPKVVKAIRKFDVENLRRYPQPLGKNIQSHQQKRANQVKVLLDTQRPAPGH